MLSTINNSTGLQFIWNKNISMWFFLVK
jgi:hypothetical protein